MERSSTRMKQAKKRFAEHEDSVHLIDTEARLCRIEYWKHSLSNFVHEKWDGALEGVPLGSSDVCHTVTLLHVPVTFRAFDFVALRLTYYYKTT